MELETAAITAEFVHGDAVSAVAWSPDESALATSSALTTGDSQSPVVTIWEIESGTSLAQYPQAEPVTSLSWSPDGLQLAILDGQSSIKIIDVP
jgi:WD40 repeat protein